MITTKPLLSACVALVLAASTECYARQLSLEEALENIPAGITASPTRSDAKVTYIEKQAGLNVAYILNRTDGDGYIVIAADNLLPGLLGYSDSGNFDPTNIPASMSAWLKQYGRQLEYAIATGLQSSALANFGEWDAVPPLCKSKWDQNKPYNNDCPDINGTKAPTGCTATAMAQVINKHKWPVTGSGVNTYTPHYTDTPLTFDFGATTFDWANMKDSYGSSYTDAEAQAVATLMAACGNASLMEYGEYESGAYPYDAVYGMVNYLGYDKSAVLAERDFYPAAVWNEMLYTELSNGRPVIYGGYTSGNAGHTFIIDGYDGKGYFHVNWGWGGMSDGYFLITALDPEEQGTGGSSAGYNFYQDAVLNVMPAREGSDYQLVVMLDGIFTTAKTAYPRSANIEFASDSEGFYKAFTLSDQNCTLGINITPTEGGETVFYPGSTLKFEATYGNPIISGYKRFRLPASSLPESGSYIVTPAYRFNDEVMDVAVRVGKQKSLVMTCSGVGVKFEEIPLERELSATGLKLDTPLYSGKNCSVSATITNHGEEFLGMVSVGLLNSNGAAIAWLDGVNINLTDGESTDVMFSGIFMNGNNPVAPGEYVINVYDEKGNLLNPEPLDVVVLETPSGTPVFTSSYKVPEYYSGNGTSSSPYLIGDSFECGLSIDVTSGLFEDLVALYAYYADDNSEAVFGEGSNFYNTFFVGEGSSQTKSYSLDTSLLDLDRTAYIMSYGWTSDWVHTSSAWFGKELYLKRTANGVDGITKDARSELYPNPADSHATVTAKSTIRNVGIFGIAGNLVKEIRVSSGESSAEIDLRGIPSGHYIVTVMTDNGIERHRLIKK